MSGRLIISLYILLISTAVADQNIRFHCQGNGPSIYLIGGGPALTSWHLQPVQKTLSQHYKVCRWDMRGVGENGHLPIDSDRTLLSQWLEDMGTVLPEEPVILWGHSWGALQVLLFAKQNPQRVRYLVANERRDQRRIEAAARIGSDGHIGPQPQSGGIAEQLAEGFGRLVDGEV